MCRENSRRNFISNLTHTNEKTVNGVFLSAGNRLQRTSTIYCYRSFGCFGIKIEDSFFGIFLCYRPSPCVLQNSERAAAIAEVIAQTDYDIIVFQEAFHRESKKYHRQ
jgi:hypothetical protein